MGSLEWMGFSLGFVYCAAPGAVNVMTLDEGLSRGPRAALGIQTGSLIGDTAYGALALAGLTWVMEQSNTHWILGILGALLLFYLGWSAIQSGRQQQRDWQERQTNQPQHAQPDRFWRPFMVGAGMSLANPWGMVFWLSLGGAVLAHLAPTSVGHSLIFLLSYVMGAVAWVAVYVASILGFRRVFRVQWLGYFGWLAGLSLWGFGLNMLASLAHLGF